MTRLHLFAARVWRFIAPLLVLMAMASSARAQTYVRPSDGASVTVFSNVSGTGSSTSSAYGFTGFDAMQITLITSDPSPCDSVDRTFAVYGSATSTGVYTQLTDERSLVQVTASQFKLDQAGSAYGFTYTVSNVSSYIKIQTSQVIAGACTISSVLMVPLALSPVVYAEGRIQQGEVMVSPAPVVVGGLTAGMQQTVYAMQVTNTGAVVVTGGGSGGEITVIPATTTTGAAVACTTVDTTAGGTIVKASSATHCGFTCVNTNTTVAVCSTNTTVTTTTGLPLNAATSAGTAGGFYEPPTPYGGDYRCITAAGSTTVCCQPVLCP